MAFNKNVKMRNNTCIEIFTDGAYSSSRDSGGVGVVFVINGEKAYEFSKRIPHSTNNQCELLAVIYALNAISREVESITIYSDSQYVIGCATKGWKRKKNVALWELYDKVLEKAQRNCSNINFSWVKGHTSSSDFFSQMNNLADKLAVEASQEYEKKE